MAMKPTSKLFIANANRRCGWSGIVPSRLNWLDVQSVVTQSDCVQMAPVGLARGKWTETGARWRYTVLTRPPRTTRACWPLSAMAKASRVRGSGSERHAPSTTRTCTPKSRSTASKVDHVITGFKTAHFLVLDFIAAVIQYTEYRTHSKTIDGMFLTKFIR